MSAHAQQDAPLRPIFDLAAATVNLQWQFYSLFFSSLQMMATSASFAYATGSMLPYRRSARISFPRDYFEAMTLIEALREKVQQPGSYVIGGYFPYKALEASCPDLGQRLIIMLQVKRPGERFDLYQGTQSGDGVTLSFRTTDSHYILERMSRHNKDRSEPIVCDELAYKNIVIPFLLEIIPLQNRGRAQRNAPLPPSRNLPNLGRLHLVS